MTAFVEDNVRPEFDAELLEIARYASQPNIDSTEAYETARLCLLDSLACALLAWEFPACTRHLGPLVPGMITPGGARVPGSSYELDPVQAAFNIGTLIRWLDFNDTWLAAEWGHPSDNLGAILACADFTSRRAVNPARWTMHDVLTAMIQAHEIQGVLALENSFNRVGLDHVVLVKCASTAVATRLLGGDEQQITAALSQAWVDGQSLRTYRHAPNAGSRKSWAAGDATSRAVRLAMLTLAGERGTPGALTAKTWGFQDVSFKGRPLVRHRPYGSYVMEHVLFKISFPAEFHAQTAVECALQLHPFVRDRVDQIERIELTTHESAIRIISKQGPLHNPADRDHCLQYMVATAMLHGRLVAEDYEDAHASDPRIDALRECMQVREDARYSRDYLDPDKRSIANAVQVFFRDGSATPRMEVEYPVGHRRRRSEGVPLLLEKFRRSLDIRFSQPQIDRILRITEDLSSLERLPVSEFLDAWVSDKT